MDHPGFSADGSTVSFLGTDSIAYFIGADGQGLRPALPQSVPGVPSLGAFVTAWSSDHHHLAVLVNGGRTIVVVDASGHLVATAYLSVGAMPIGVALDGSGQYAYYMGMVGTFPNATTRLYSVALHGGTSQPVGGDDLTSFPLTVLAT
jgi:DNA-binding beta-propeller fold protein YncE